MKKYHAVLLFTNIRPTKLLMDVAKRLSLELLYKWYFLQSFDFRYFHALHDSALIISFK